MLKVIPIAFCLSMAWLFAYLAGQFTKARDVGATLILLAITIVALASAWIVL